MRKKGTSGFTIIELITVIAMILILMGAVTASVAGARRRAKIQQAISEAQQLTDAILSYENFVTVQGVSALEKKVTGESWKEATAGELKFVLGNEKLPDGQDVPVLYNGAVRGGKILDPWGKPYLYRIMSSAIDEDDEHTGNQGEAAFAIPNINRIPADEVN